MTTQHPYSQGGWAGQSASGCPAPSVFGALPYPSAPPVTPPNLITFHLTSFNPDLLNCMVFAPHSRAFMRVVTDSSMPGFTIWKDISSQTSAMVNWQGPPTVEIRNLVPRQSVRSWLRLSSDKSSRIMEVGNSRYVWAPSGGALYLYASDGSRNVLAKVSRSQGLLSLDMTPQAMQLGLLESCVVASVLLQCGRRLE